MKKAYFQYYETFENILEKIKDIEEREHLRKTIINYGLHGIEPNGLSELEEIAWTICKELIDQQHHRREVNAANRAAKKTEPATTEENSAAAPEQESQSEKPKVKKFVKPTVEEIAAYCQEKNYTINAKQFFNYYESNGWRIGRNPMKSWHAALQTWQAREKTGTIWANNSTDAGTAGYEDYFN